MFSLIQVNLDIPAIYSWWFGVSGYLLSMEFRALPSVSPLIPHTDISHLHASLLATFVLHVPFFYWLNGHYAS